MTAYTNTSEREIKLWTAGDASAEPISIPPGQTIDLTDAQLATTRAKRAIQSGALVAA